MHVEQLRGFQLLDFDLGNTLIIGLKSIIKVPYLIKVDHMGVSFRS